MASEFQDQTPPPEEKSVHAHNNLIVNYIPGDMNQADLLKLFSPFGTVTSCRLITDKSTGVSLGYGFIKYQTDEEAEKAVNALNGHPIGRKILKVSVARQEKSNVYIAGFPTNWSKTDVEALIGQFGKTMESRILLDNEGKSRGVGFVRLETNEQAANCVQTLNGQIPPGCTKPLQVKIAQYPISGAQQPRKKHMVDMNMILESRSPYAFPKSYGKMTASRNGNASTPYSRPSPSPPASASASSASVFPLHPNLNSLNISSLPLSLNPQAYNSSSGFDGNMFGGPMPTAPALDPFGLGLANPHQLPLQGLNFAPELAPPFLAVPPAPKFAPGAQHMGICLFVYHVPASCTEDQLYALFSAYGQVLNVKIMRDIQTGASKSYAFVNMATQEQAQMAINALNGYNLNGKYLKVSFKTDKQKAF